MNSQKKIEINQSSLLGLKAELLRKKNEVSTAKYSQQLSNTKVIKKKLSTKFDKANEGVGEREQRDAEEIQQESDDLKKSQRILEEKAKLYDKLTKTCLGSVNSSIDASNFLVDFRQKANEDSAENKESKSSESDYGDYSDDEDEWVDFVDCLGRTKRCHRDDLQMMKERDEKLRVSLYGDSKRNTPQATEERERESYAGIQLPQLCSEDMKREILRQKWEEQERNLLDKKNVHYQDVLFDEARTHGVGYYGFSTDEAERVRQQDELRKLRKETEEHQVECQSVAQRKKKQMEERLKAARRRKRERLGLPPEEEAEGEEGQGREDGGVQQKGVLVAEAKEEEKKAEPPEELRRDVRRPGPLRPWDVGKDGTGRILTQEEWVNKKRAERPEEFAPPSLPQKRKHQSKREATPPPKQHFAMEPVAIEDELEEEPPRGRGGAQIPPPPTFDLYGPSSHAARSTQFVGLSEIDRSIEEGLEFLRKKAEAKKAKRPVEESDIM